MGAQGAYQPKTAVPGPGRLLLHCGHAYHSSCIFKWLAQRQICPICNAAVDLVTRGESVAGGAATPLADGGGGGGGGGGSDIAGGGADDSADGGGNADCAVGRPPPAAAGAAARGGGSSKEEERKWRKLRKKRKWRGSTAGHGPVEGEAAGAAGEEDGWAAVREAEWARANEAFARGGVHSMSHRACWLPLSKFPLSKPPSVLASTF
jgi:hypothetical protein